MSSKITLAALCLFALVSGFYLQIFGFNLPLKFNDNSQPQIEGLFWPDQKILTEFEMVDTDNRPFTGGNLENRWNFVFFGYTHCPDICPVTMNTMKQVRANIQNSNQINVNNLNFLFVSVDGERDTPEHLRKYLNFFGDGFTGATGNPTQVESLTSQLGVPYAIEDHEPGSKDYLVSHSGAIFLISPSGTLASIFQPPHSVEQISRKFSEISTFMENNS